MDYQKMIPKKKKKKKMIPSQLRVRKLSSTQEAAFFPFALYCYSC